MNKSIIATLIASLLNSVAAMDGHPPLSAEQPTQPAQKLSFDNIKEAYKSYIKASNDTDQKKLKTTIIFELNNLWRTGQITNENRAEAIQIAKGVNAGTLATRLEETSSHMMELPKELWDPILAMVSQGASVKELKEMLTVSKGFNKLFLTAPLHLDLSEGKFQSVESLEKLFLIFPNISSLDLWYNDIDDAGVTAIANSPNLTSLTSLSLSRNKIGDAGATAIANSKHLTSLTSLSLRGNFIGDAGATAIANSPNLTSLTSLGLGLNSISDAGATAIANSKHLTSLTSLDLYYNNIGNAGATAIANSKHMTSLTSLGLGLNFIGDAGATAIANSKHLTSLNSLNLMDNKIGYAARKILRGAKPNIRIFF